MKHRLLEQLELMLEPVIVSLGCELVGIEYIGQSNNPLLRIYIDAEDGVTVAACQRVSRQVSAVLDVEDPIRSQYTLEVSSPGLDRPLFKAAHYVRFVGHKVRLKLMVPHLGRRNFTGILLGCQDEQVEIEVDGEKFVFSLSEIDKAKLVSDL